MDITNIRQLTREGIRTATGEILNQPKSRWSEARKRLLEDTVDVGQLVADCIESYVTDPAAFSRSFQGVPDKAGFSG